MKNKKILKFAEDNPFFAFVVILFLFVTFLGLPAEAQKTFSPQTLFERQRKISEIRARLESLLVSSQIKARCILTKEQFGRLPRGYPLGMGTIYETETGTYRVLQKGIRY